jgi:chromosomal replication initiator protein
VDAIGTERNGRATQSTTPLPTRLGGAGSNASGPRSARPAVQPLSHTKAACSDADPTRTDPASAGRSTESPTQAGTPDFSTAPHSPLQHAKCAQAFRECLSNDIGPTPLQRYFGSDVRIAVADESVVVSVATAFHKAVIDRRFGPSLLQAALATGHQSVRVVVDETMRSADAPALGAVHTRPVAPAARPTLRPEARAARTERHELSSFIVGASNRMAFSAVSRVANDAQGREFSPLFLHGPSGVGKSHLLHGAAAQFRRLHPGATVRYTTAEAFTNAYITAVRETTLDKFRKTWRGVDLLCIDDVHFFSRKEGTQSELLHTFDAIDLEGARILLASDEHPRRIAALSGGLVSRFLSGAVVRIDPPDETLRLQLVRTLANRRGAKLSADAAALIADRAGMPDSRNASVRDIEGVLTQVIAISQLLPEFLSADGEIGLVAVRQALGLGEWTTQRPQRSKPVRFEVILDQACRVVGVERGDVLGSTRHRRVVLARTIVSFLARNMTTMSFPEVARGLHRPSHSTVVAAEKRMKQMIIDEEPVRVGPDLDGLTIGQLIERIRTRIETACDRGS